MVKSSLPKILSMCVVSVGLAACGDGTAGTGAAGKDSATPATSTTTAKSSAPASSTTASAATSAATPAPSATDSAVAKPDASAAPSAVASSAPPAGKGPVAGKPWQVVASADADAGYHCNSEYPNKFTTTGGTNVTYPDPKPRGGCAGNRVVVNIPIVPTNPGPGTVVGTLSYGICDDSKTNCQTKKKEMTLTFTAQ